MSELQVKKNENQAEAETAGLAASIESGRARARKLSIIAAFASLALASAVLGGALFATRSVPPPVPAQESAVPAQEFVPIAVPDDSASVSPSVSPSVLPLAEGGLERDANPDAALDLELSEVADLVLAYGGFADDAEPRAPEGERAPVVAPEALAPNGGESVPLWQQRALPTTLGRGPRVIIVLDDLGNNVAAAERSLALPGPLTLSFLSYTPALADWAERTRERGHEFLLHVPMQPRANLDPGPGSLRAGDSEATLLANLRGALDRGGANFIGINNHMGSLATEDERLMRTVLGELAARELIFLDSRTTAKSVAPRIARELGLAFAERDVFLDHDPTPAAIRIALNRLERRAQTNGYAVAIAHPHPETLKALENWLPQAAEKGLVLTPLGLAIQEAGGHLPRPAPLR